jgi:hypothetical protein
MKITDIAAARHKQHLICKHSQPGMMTSTFLIRSYCHS